MRIALNATLYSFTGPDDIDALLESANQLLQLETEEEVTTQGVEALLARILAFLHRGDMSNAKNAIDFFGRMVSRLNRVEGEWFYQRLLAQRTLDEGRFDNAIQRFSKLTERAKLIGMYYFDVFYQVQQAYIMRACGATTEQVHSLCTQTIESFRRVPASLAEIIGLVVEMGYPELVRDAYSRLISQGLDSIPRNGVWLNALCNLTLAAVAFDGMPEPCGDSGCGRKTLCLLPRFSASIGEAGERLQAPSGWGLPHFPLGRGFRGSRIVPSSG